MYQASLIFENELTPQSGSKIPVGIHLNCKVKSVVTGLSSKGEKFVDINFEDADGRPHNKRLWTPNADYPQKDETPEQVIKRKETINLSTLIKIVHIFYGKEGLTDLNGEYEPLMEKLIKKLTPEVLSKKGVNLKLIYNSSGEYSDFGTYPDYVEEYVEGQPAKLRYTPWETANRLKPKAAPVDESALLDQAPMSSAYDIDKIL